MKISHLFIPLLATAALAFGAPKSDEASDLVRKYVEAVAASDAPRLASLFHPDVQAIFKDLLIKDTLMPRGYRSTNQLLADFGVKSPAELTLLSPEAATERMLRYMFSLHNDKSRALAASMRPHIIGVLEENSVYYVVFRMSASLEQTSFDTTNVATLREHEGKLRLLVTPDSQGLKRLVDAETKTRP